MIAIYLTLFAFGVFDLLRWSPGRVSVRRFLVALAAATAATAALARAGRSG